MKRDEERGSESERSLSSSGGSPKRGSPGPLEKGDSKRFRKDSQGEFKASDTGTISQVERDERPSSVLTPNSFDGSMENDEPIVRSVSTPISQSERRGLGVARAKPLERQGGGSSRAPLQDLTNQLEGVSVDSASAHVQPQERSMQVDDLAPQALVDHQEERGALPLTFVEAHHTLGECHTHSALLHRGLDHNKKRPGKIGLIKNDTQINLS
tara:strand:+ start:2033 stop:2668 length:636 start_codon:yes stop_codon:yes gene_type:complete